MKHGVGVFVGDFSHAFSTQKRAASQNARKRSHSELIAKGVGLLFGSRVGHDDTKVRDKKNNPAPTLKSVMPSGARHGLLVISAFDHAARQIAATRRAELSETSIAAIMIQHSRRR